VSVSDEYLADDEIYQAVKQIVFRMHFDYGKPQPDEEYLISTAMSWRDHLKGAGIPACDVDLLYASTVSAKARTNGAAYMPVIGDLLHEWDQWLEAGYWEKQNAPAPEQYVPALEPGADPLPGGINTSRAPAFVKTFQQFIARHGGPVTCQCPGDRWGRPPAKLVEETWGSFWKCADGRCDFCIKADDLLSLVPIAIPLGADSPAAEAPMPEPPREYSDAELLDALREHCNLDSSKTDDETALSFARYLLAIAAPDLWTLGLAKSQWKKWKASATEVAA
jgi:hypothetical protein